MKEETHHCLIRIRSNYKRFSDKEKLIADYILDDPTRIVHGTINQIAEDLTIADSTVFRFCKRIGFKGYQAMKIALAAEIVGPIKDIHEDINEDDDVRTVADKVFSSNHKTLDDTLKVMDYQSLSEAVTTILHARRVDFFGSGGSNIIAQDAYHKFMRTGITSFAQADTHLQLMAASQLTSDDVAVIISHTGSTKDSIQILNVAKDQGAKTIGITTYAKSPLSNKVDIVLYTVSEETDYRSEALSSRIAQLSIIDALYVNVLMAKKEAGKQSLQKMRNALSAKRI